MNSPPRKKWNIAVALLGFLIGGLSLARAQNEAVEALFPAPAPSSTTAKTQVNSPPATGDILQSEKELEEMQKQLAAIETRLGITSRQPSVANTMERRFADLEKRMQQIEQQLTRMQQFDQRIRRLEMK